MIKTTLKKKLLPKSRHAAHDKVHSHQCAMISIPNSFCKYSQSASQIFTEWEFINEGNTVFVLGEAPKNILIMYSVNIEWMNEQVIVGDG